MRVKNIFICAGVVFVLGNIEDIAFCRLTSKDVVRHPLVQRIVSLRS